MCRILSSLSIVLRLIDGLLHSPELKLLRVKCQVFSSASFCKWQKAPGNLKSRLALPPDGELRCSPLHCRGRIKGRNMPVGWFNTAGAAPCTSPGTARSPWVGVAPGSRSLRGRTRADASWPPFRRITPGIGGGSDHLASPCCWPRCDAGPALCPRARNSNS